MTALIGVVSIGVFLVALWLLRLVPAAAKAVATALSATETMRDENADDAAREKAAQAAALSLLGSFFSILIRGTLAIGLSAVPIWLGDLAGMAPFDAAIAFLSRWDVIVVSSIVIIIGYTVGSRLWKPR
jgi:hypothetical protein